MVEKGKKLGKDSRLVRECDQLGWPFPNAPEIDLHVIYGMFFNLHIFGDLPVFILLLVSSLIPM